MEDREHTALVLRAKAELRKRLRGLRRTTPASALAKRSERIVATLATRLEGAKCVALFWPMASEVDLRPLDASLRARGVAIAYPSIDPETREMTFRVVDAVADLEEDALGFHGAAQGASEPASLDAIVVPALALDATGRRLGYGAGFYDRALPRWTTAKTIGVVFDFQLLAEVPVLRNDVAVDVVVTDTRTLEVHAET